MTKQKTLNAFLYRSIEIEELEAWTKYSKALERRKDLNWYCAVCGASGNPGEHYSKVGDRMRAHRTCRCPMRDWKNG